MSVTETIRAIGSWSVTLRDDVPQTIVDKLRDRVDQPAYFGHICIHSGRLSQVDLSDALMGTSRYTGVYRSFERKSGQIVLGGAGMSFWLGDEDQKGQVIENLRTFSASPFVDTIRALLPSSVHEGTLHDSVAGAFTGTFQYTDPRTAIDYVCTTMGGEYRVNGDATLDAGLVSDLYRTIPTCSLVAHDAGVDMDLRALPGDFDTSQDVEDFSTRVLLLAQGDGAATATGSANINPDRNPYKDRWGNTVTLTRMVSESTTDTGNADQRAQLSLSQFESTRDALTLDTSDYDIKGDFEVGDNIFVYDPEQGLFDNLNEVEFRGKHINPLILRCTESTWPVSDNMSVAFRTPAGEWIDLTEWVSFEFGTSTVVVGGYNRELVSTSEPVGSRPIADSSVPGIVTWITPFTQAVYQSPVNGQTRAQAQLRWNQPTNTDGSAIIDGDHYEIQYRQSSTPIFPSTWAQVEGMTWGEVETATWGQPIEYPVGPWQSTVVGFDELAFVLEELIPSHPYEVRIRAVDSAAPPNFGEWSEVFTFQTSDDTIPPQTPAPPVVDSSLVAIQITHTLGAATGGTFNLDADLHHLEIHGQYEPTFIPDDTTLIGKLVATNGMITGQIPAVGTFTLPATTPTYFKVVAVDTAGNKSLPSTGVVATPDLIDSEHISDLTASKITAGTITSDILLAGSFKTATTGARTEIDSNGIRGYALNGTRIFNQDTNTGQVSMSAGNAGGQRIDITPDDGAGQPRIDIYDNDQSTHTTLISFSANFLMQRENNGTRADNGGYFQWQQGDSFVGHHNSSGSFDSFFQWNESAQQLSLQGRWAKGQSFGGQTGFFVDTIHVGAGFGSLVVGYGGTMVGGMNLNANILDGAGVNPNSILASTTTNYTVGWTSPRDLFVFAQGWRVA